MNKCKYRPQQEAVSTRFFSSFLAAEPHRSGRCFRTIAERESQKEEVKEIQETGNRKDWLWGQLVNGQHSCDCTHLWGFSSTMSVCVFLSSIRGPQSSGSGMFLWHHQRLSIGIILIEQSVSCQQDVLHKFACSYTVKLHADGMTWQKVVPSLRNILNE